MNDLEIVKPVVDDLLFVYINMIKRLRNAAYQIVSPSVV